MHTASILEKRLDCRNADWFWGFIIFQSLALLTWKLYGGDLVSLALGYHSYYPTPGMDELFFSRRPDGGYPTFRHKQDGGYPRV